MMSQPELEQVTSYHMDPTSKENGKSIPVLERKRKKNKDDSGVPKKKVKLNDIPYNLGDVNGQINTTQEFDTVHVGFFDEHFM